MKKALASAKYRTAKMINTGHDDTDDKTLSGLKEESRRTHEHKTHLKETVRRLQKQVKALSAEMEESSSVEAGFRGYSEQQLSEYDGRDYAELMQRISEILLAIDTHKKKLNDILSERCVTGLQVLLDEDIKAATNSQKKYDRLKYDYEAADSKVRSLKPKDSAEKRSALEKERDELRDAMDTAGKEALNALSLTNAKIQLTGMTEFMRIFITYKEYFTRVSTQLNKIEPEMSTYRRILERKREDFYKTKETSVMSSRLFGAPLEDITTREGSFVPAFVSTSCTFLVEFGIKEEGIFRLTPAMSVLEQYRNIVEKAGKDIDYSGVTDAHIVSCLLKQFLREMPEPLMTFAKYPEFKKAGSIKDVEDKVAEIKRVVEKLPEVNFLTLKEIMYMSYSLAAHKDVTKMGSSNLAVVLGPNILYPRQSDPTTMTEDIETANNVVATMIDKYKDIFAETDPFKAAERGDIESLEKFRQDGIDLYGLRDEKDDKDLLSAAADAGRLNVVKWLIEDIGWEDINRQDKHGMTPVFRSVNQKREKVALYLASKGANVEISAKNGATVWDKIPSHLDFYRKLSAVSKIKADRNRPKLTLNSKGSFVLQSSSPPPPSSPHQESYERSQSFSHESAKGGGTLTKRTDRSSTALPQTSTGSITSPLSSSYSPPAIALELKSSKFALNDDQNDDNDENEKEKDKNKDKDKDKDKEKEKEKEKEKVKEGREKEKGKERERSKEKGEKEKKSPEPKKNKKEQTVTETNPVQLSEPPTFQAQFIVPRRDITLKMESFSSTLAQFSYLLKHKDLKQMVTIGVRVLFQCMKNWLSKLHSGNPDDELYVKSTTYQNMVQQTKQLNEIAKVILQNLKSSQDTEDTQVIVMLDKTFKEFTQTAATSIDSWEGYRHSCLKIVIHEAATLTTKLLHCALGVAGSEPLDVVKHGVQTLFSKLLSVAQERAYEIPNPSIQAKILDCRQIIMESTEKLIQLSKSLVDSPSDDNLKSNLNQTAKLLASQFGIISSFCSPSPFFTQQIKNFDPEHSNNNYYNLVNECETLREGIKLFDESMEKVSGLICNPRDQIILTKTKSLSENLKKTVELLEKQKVELEESGIATGTLDSEANGKILPLSSDIIYLALSSSQDMMSIVDHCLKISEKVDDFELQDSVQRYCHVLVTYSTKIKMYCASILFLNRGDSDSSEHQISFGQLDESNQYQNTRTVILFSLYGSSLALKSALDPISEVSMTN